jgi:hypothetical protein
MVLGCEPEYRPLGIRDHHRRTGSFGSRTYFAFS